MLGGVSSDEPVAGPGNLRTGTPAGRWVLATTVLGSGLAMLDSTVVNVALERIGSDFGASFAGLQWTINAYTLTLAGFILLGGSLGDRFGRRRIFLVGVVWFAVASALCGFAPSIDVLIGARALQGIGGALLTPGSLALISASFHGDDRAAAIGAWSGLAGVAGAVGPFIGGWLVEWNWRAVFLINLPLAAVVLVAALRHVPESRDPQAVAHLDVPGTALGLAGLGALTWSLTEAGTAGASAAVVVTGLVGVAALVAFGFVERRSRSPLVPTDLFKNPLFSALNVVTLLVYAALGVLFVLLVLQLQVVAGFSPLGAGRGDAADHGDHAAALGAGRTAGLADRAAHPDDGGPRHRGVRDAPAAAGGRRGVLLVRRAARGADLRAGPVRHGGAPDGDGARRRRRPPRRGGLGGQQRGRAGGRAPRGGGDPGGGGDRGRGLHEPGRVLGRVPPRRRSSPRACCSAGRCSPGCCCGRCGHGRRAR